MKGIRISKPWRPNRGFPSGSVVKNLLANAGDTGDIEDMGSIPGCGISSGEEMATHSSILA